MCEEIIKKIYDISKEYDVKKVKIVTNHIKICGELCKCENLEKLTSVVTLQNAKIWKLEDLCKCGDSACHCSTPHIIEVEWLHVNVDKIVAFTLM